MKLYSVQAAVPTALPVAIADFKGFVRQYSDHEDSVIRGILAGAVSKVEHYVQRSLESQTRIAYLSGPPDRILELDMGPVTSITSVQYRRASDAVLVTIDPNTYTLENDRLFPAALALWPAVNEAVPSSFQVTYVAGYVDNSVSPAVGALPGQLQTALFLMAQAVYHRRTDCEEAATSLLDTMRVGQGV